MEPKRKKFTPHSEETITKLLELHDAGMRSKDIYKQSKEIFGYRIQQSTISNILNRNGRNAKENTYRVKRHYHPAVKKTSSQDQEPGAYKSPIDLSDYPHPEGISAVNQLAIDLKRKSIAKKYGNTVSDSQESNYEAPETEFEPEFQEYEEFEEPEENE